MKQLITEIGMLLCTYCLKLYIHVVHVGTMKQQQELLCNEVHKLTERQTGLLAHSSQLQKLATMLQETHKYGYIQYMYGCTCIRI